MQSLSRFEERYLNPPEIYYDEDDNPMSEQEYRRRQRELWDAAQPEYMGEEW